MNLDDVRRRWVDRSGEFSPEYYAYRGPDERSDAVLAVLDGFVDRDARVLELGCGPGRHLAHLHEHGFEDLAGIDVNGDAFDVMAGTYPDLADAGTFHVDAIEDAVGDFGDGQFDAVYSVETLQHIHPDAGWVFAELSRIADDLLVTVENEGVDPNDGEDADDGGDAADSPPVAPDVSYVADDIPLYHRDWNRIFTGLGLAEVAVRPGGRDTLRAFRAPGQ